MNMMLGVSAKETIAADQLSVLLQILTPESAGESRSLATQDVHHLGLSLHQNQVAHIFKGQPLKAAPFLKAEQYAPAQTALMQLELALATLHTNYANNVPFERELGGRSWTFIHDSALKNLNHLDLKDFHPLGTTAAEYAFCLLLDATKPFILKNGQIENPQALLKQLSETTSRITESGHFNYILTNGTYLFAHSHTRLDVLFSPITHDNQAQQICLIASQQMTDDELWSCLLPHALTMITEGQIIGQTATKNPASQADWQQQTIKFGTIETWMQQNSHTRRQRFARGDGHLYESS